MTTSGTTSESRTEPTAAVCAADTAEESASIPIGIRIRERAWRFTEKQNSIENYIVGTTGDFDPYMSLKVSLRSSDAECLGGLTSEDKKAILDQILNADLSGLKDAIALFEKVNEADNVCVIGNKGAITKASECFDEIFDLNQKR